MWRHLWAIDGTSSHWLVNKKGVCLLFMDQLPRSTVLVIIIFLRASPIAELSKALKPNARCPLPLPLLNVLSYTISSTIMLPCKFSNGCLSCSHMRR